MLVRAALDHAALAHDVDFIYVSNRTAREKKKKKSKQTEKRALSDTMHTKPTKREKIAWICTSMCIRMQARDAV